MKILKTVERIKLKILNAAIGHSILCQAFQALFITQRFELLCVSFDLDDIEK